VDFSSAVLARADLRASSFTRVSFSNADLSGADLRRSSFSGCNFKGATLVGSRLTSAAARGLGLSDEQRKAIAWETTEGPEPLGG
jgi:BTB/POZ domain-containing protein KCTD9